MINQTPEDHERARAGYVAMREEERKMRAAEEACAECAAARDRAEAELAACRAQLDGCRGENFVYDQDHRALAAANGELVKALTPQWIVNNLGELGCRVGDRFYFIYKYDDPLVYTTADGCFEDDDAKPLMWRPIYKREFGETQWPEKWIRAGRREDEYTDGEGWQPLPLAPDPDLAKHAAPEGGEETTHD